MVGMSKEYFLDLTHSLSPDIPSWDGSTGFEIDITGDYTDFVGTDAFRTQEIHMKAGMGTHIDAPAHCFAGQKTVDQLAPEDLVADCIAVNVAEWAGEDFIITPDIIEKFEKDHGRIPERSFVIFHTGWSARWSDKGAYINDHKFPSVHEDTAKLLLGRGVAGLGIDTLSPDTGLHGFPVHRIILGAGRYIVENIANTDKLPPVGAKIFVMPMKIRGGTEAPVRLMARTEK